METGMVILIGVIVGIGYGLARLYLKHKAKQAVTVAAPVEDVEVPRPLPESKPE